MIDMVLATDMSCHFQQIKAAKTMLTVPELRFATIIIDRSALNPLRCLECLIIIIISSPFIVLQRGQVKDFVSGAALLRRCSSEQTMAIAQTLDRSFARRILSSG